ncbi:MAG TPA: xylulose 5-phosphate 3-epimerase, partial [Gammaproteobacteria bacterium]|nr:xylulose 5-phosphate 3-epimerase [Gammaproteobacteria bacterium]
MDNARNSISPSAQHLNAERFTTWARGHGVIRHTTDTQKWLAAVLGKLAQQGVTGDGVDPLELLIAADRIASAAMWLVVHMTYARRVRLDGKPLLPDEFKPDPQGHTGGTLNMVPAYVGFMLANALTGITRGWIMGQGHCVAAIDSVNLLLDNMRPEHAARYSVSEPGLTRYVNDFYSYRLNESGNQDSPLGSHVNINTAGGALEGGYLGFAELQYVHMPLPGERLVAFLSDGAWEEQRGSDWVPHWWRAEDSGLVVPILINNVRRIDQRVMIAQEGGLEAFKQHQALHHFDPIVFDGRDPAAFACMIIEGEHLLTERAQGIQAGVGGYPVKMPYGIAVTEKGAGFYGAGTNDAHNLPLGANPRKDPLAARHFNNSTKPLYVPPAELDEARATLQNHAGSSRPRERDHPIANRDVRLTQFPHLPFRPITPLATHDPAHHCSAMEAIDSAFLAHVQANPELRPRVGNPDEMRSNRMDTTLDYLKHRVTQVEPGIAESLHGAVITALNEEAVISACLGNKG